MQIVNELFAVTMEGVKTSASETIFGLDFGTSNSALACMRNGRAELCPLGESADPTWRTVLYFDPDEDRIFAGGPAIERYLERGGEGRLVQSIKSYLASALFSQTTILGRTWTLERLVGEFIAQLARAAGADPGRRLVVGRPVRYWGARDENDDRRAVRRMREALQAVGFDEVVFEFEPNAAAARYADRLDHDELILVADFGGGTSDFSLVRVGPGIDPGATDAVLATSGIGIGGDSFDACLIDAQIAPALGKGSEFADEMGARAPVPTWLYSKLRRWHHLSFLKAPDTMRLIHRVARGAIAPERVDRLVRLVEEDLGLALHRSVEQCKIQLSAADRGRLHMAILGIDADMDRRDFDALIEAELAAIDTIVDDVLERAGVSARDVQRVFATGGSSLVPAVRKRLATRFGPDALVSGEELTSVAAGLARRGQALFD